MLLPKESNPSEYATEPAGGLQNRLRELELRNSQLQMLIVELLDKNEQLRRALAQREQRP